MTQAMTHDVDVDVVVAGGGPVGLMLACELRLGGASVVVAERLTEVDRTVKAGAINVPTGEALYRRGLLPAAEAARDRARAHAMAFMARTSPGGVLPRKVASFAGHFAGLPMTRDRLDMDDPAFAGHGPVDNIGLLAQADLEELLAEHAAALGVDLRRGVELTGFDADDEGVTVHTDPGPPIRAGWLVGCDGGRSTVRKLAGFDFPGTEPAITGHQAIVEMEGGEALGVSWNTTATGIYVNGPMPGRILTVEFDGPPADRDAPVTAEELQASLRAVSGVDVTITKVLSATRFTDNARQAATYRLGRVLLAGDAAHVHSPFGGQGLNLGIGDAMNLGWKLAATVRGDAPDGLLDTYTTERHPLGAWVLEWTRAQVALMRPEPRARALRAVMSELMEDVSTTTYFVKKLSGVWQRYDLPGDHPLVGASAPDLELDDGTRLADHLRDGRALLLDLAAGPELRARAEGFGDRLRVVTAGCAGRPELAGLLVRPDGHVAWAAAADGLPDTLASLDAALASWLGAPAAVLSDH